MTRWWHIYDAVIYTISWCHPIDLMLRLMPKRTAFDARTEHHYYDMALAYAIYPGMIYTGWRDDGIGMTGAGLFLNGEKRAEKLWKNGLFRTFQHHSDLLTLGNSRHKVCHAMRKGIKQDASFSGLQVRFVKKKEFFPKVIPHLNR